MILLTGSTGFIGKHYKEMSKEDLLCPTHQELDLTNTEDVNAYLNQHKPEKIIHCASNDHDICLYDNLRMFYNLAESKIPMITFCTGREVEDRSYKNGEYVLSKRMVKELSLLKYHHIAVIQIWGCFGAHEKDIRFFKSNMMRVNRGEQIIIDEDRMFSYVYVKDVVKIMQSLQPELILQYGKRLIRLVAYTDFFSNYAIFLEPGEWRSLIKRESFSKSYVGKNSFEFDYTPLKDALLDMWKDLDAI